MTMDCVKSLMTMAQGDLEVQLDRYLTLDDVIRIWRNVHEQDPSGSKNKAVANIMTDLFRKKEELRKQLRKICERWEQDGKINESVDRCVERLMTMGRGDLEKKLTAEMTFEDVKIIWKNVHDQEPRGEAGSKWAAIQHIIKDLYPQKDKLKEELSWICQKYPDLGNGGEGNGNGEETNGGNGNGEETNGGNGNGEETNGGNGKSSIIVVFVFSVAIAVMAIIFNEYGVTLLSILGAILILVFVAGVVYKDFDHIRKLLEILLGVFKHKPE